MSEPVPPAAESEDLGPELALLRRYLEAEAGRPTMPRITGWSRDQHLDHVLRVLRNILKAVALLVTGDDPRILDDGEPTAAGRRILASGTIPRGRADAPETTLPAEPGLTDLQTLFDDVAARHERLVPHLPALPSLPGRLPHPVLGPFSATQWMRFAKIHTRHHLAIVDDMPPPAQTT